MGERERVQPFAASIGLGFGAGHQWTGASLVMLDRR
jgi:hypothetical protein